MRQLLLGLFMGSLAIPVQAQYEKILADPSITWAAELELTLTPDVDDYTWPGDSLNASTVLKSVSTEPEDSPYRDPKSLMKSLFEGLYNDAYPTYTDPSLQVQLPKGAWLDSIFAEDVEETIDPVTQEKILSLWSHCWSEGDLLFLKVRQLLIYRNKTASFELLTYAIAPVMPSGKTPFWIRVPIYKHKKKPGLNDPNITWARRLTTKGASLEIAALASRRQPSVALMPVFIQKVRTDPAVALRSHNWEKTSFADRDQLLGINQVDTVETFDAETYESKTVIMHSNLEVNSLQRLRLVQDWFWDDRRKELRVHLAAVAPMIDVLDAEGNFRYTRPLFYLLGD